MRIVFFGTPDFAVPSLEALAGAGHEISLVLTRPDRPSGRGLKLRPTPVKLSAERLGLPVLQPDNPNETAAVSKVEQASPDVLCVVAYGAFLGKRLLEIPRLYPLNAHASLLPRWRGASPIHAAILAGDEEAGVTIMKITGKLDSGGIALTGRIPIEADETAGTLHEKTKALAAELLVETLARAEKDELVFTVQDESRVTYAPKLGRSDERLDFSRSAEYLERQVRALSPWPCASATVNIAGLDVEMKVSAAGTEPPPPGKMEKISAGNINARPGIAFVAEPASGLWVGTGEGLLELREVKIPGRKACTARAFLAGFPGTRHKKRSVGEA